MSGAEAVIGTIASVVAVCTSARDGYKSIQDMRDLPVIFRQVEPKISIIIGTLETIQEEARTATIVRLEEINKVAASCQPKVDKLSLISEKLKVDDSNSLIDKYVSIVRRWGKKGRVEDLLKDLIQAMVRLAAHCSVATAREQQLSLLKQALTDLEETGQSIPDSMLEARGTSISIAGTGTQQNQIGNNNTLNSTGGGHVFGSPPRILTTDEACLLWIKGDPGKGKTMLLCGIINERKTINPGILLNILRRPLLVQNSGDAHAFLVIDALDECTILSTCPRVKWIASSRSFYNIEERLRTAEQISRLSLELNKDSVSAAVKASHLFKNFQGTFLWAALAIRALYDVAIPSKVHPTLRSFLPGFDSPYERARYEKFNLFVNSTSPGYLDLMGLIGLSVEVIKELIEAVCQTKPNPVWRLGSR
ncbi:hypothetical protein GGTG_08482 [Gaeumannomyces tritici R3-111a-1]|uniref:NACHT-NTPase and P-loop NTPases N-terminal domain-containing protein n=1 Tax=Gaeumannomyces tritici (strain R3-111a-1) TaxID=644352 RepID=J3P4P5_GAET3|nr:hypothetical protein GGTG_08482 [Gaeumannomyces tritici R3-111a-1]EJT74642.1 hypothetical protein GGTG_08482 [Gaeumannomyces tritici R3-111a-1]